MGFMDWLKKLLEPAPPSKPARKTPAKKRPASTRTTSASGTTPRTTHSAQLKKTAAAPTPFRPGKLLVNDARWIRANEQVEFRNMAIRGGLLYIGTHLTHGSSDIEPSLIDPALPVSAPRDGAYGDDLPYWPSYARITASQRGVYLRWLAEERRDPQIPIGYGFLFLYGLERRLLLDRQAATDAGELPVIRDELLALVSILGPKNESFRSASEQLIGLIDLLLVDRALANQVAGPAASVPPPPPPPLLPNNRATPVTLRIGLGILARNRSPIPVDWALAWAWHAPATTIRGAANRCPEEFAALFATHYRERYGDGIVLDPDRLQRLTLAIQPFSAVIDAQQIATRHLPDVLPSPMTGEVGFLIGEVTSALDDYSRWVARYPLRRQSLAAWSWLPEALRIPDSPFAARITLQLNALLGADPIAIVPGEEIVRLWMGDEPTLPEKLSRDFGSTAAASLGRLGYGLEPDPRTGVQLALGMPVALFCLPTPVMTDTSYTPESGIYDQVVTLLQLAAIVAEADGETSLRETSAMHQHIRASFSLSPQDEQRLQARLALQAAHPAAERTRTLAGMKRRITPLTQEERTRLATGLVRLADADGTISPDEVTTLQKIWKLLGRDPERVASELHAVITGGRLETDRPRNDVPVVRRATPAPPGVPIPPRHGTPGTPPQPQSPPRPQDKDLSLDAATIARTMADSAAVSALLGDLLTEETPPAPASTIPAPTASHPEPDTVGELIQAIAAQETWEIAAFTTLAEAHGLLPAAALDQVNEFAFETADGPLLIEEADGSLSVDPDVLAVVLPIESV